MTYFLDFDRTLFDTPSFKKTLAKRPAFRHVVAQSKHVIAELNHPSRSLSKRRILAKTLGTYVSHGHLGFHTEELKEFLYPDVPEFLSAHGPECVIVTYGVRAFITAKVTNALLDFHVNEIVYTRRRKGRTIRRLCKDKEGPFIFVDDMHFQLQSVHAACPDVKVIEMRRDSSKGDGQWPVIHSLDELTSLL